MKNKIIFAFLFFNAFFVILYGAFFFMPIIESAQNGQENIAAMTRRYYTEREAIAEYENNKQELADLNAKHGFLDGMGLISTIALLSNISSDLGLHSSEFVISSISPHYINHTKIYEIRARANYSGDFSSLINYLQTTSQHMFFHSFTLQHYENSRLWLEFSLFQR